MKAWSTLTSACFSTMVRPSAMFWLARVIDIAMSMATRPMAITTSSKVKPRRFCLDGFGVMADRVGRIARFPRFPSASRRFHTSGR